MTWNRSDRSRNILHSNDGSILDIQSHHNNYNIHNMNAGLVGMNNFMELTPYLTDLKSDKVQDITVKQNEQVNRKA